MIRISNKPQKVITNSKQRILKISSELFSEFGFLGVSMEEIAKRLNITKAALYYHFKSKKELYLEVLNGSFESLVRNIDKSIKRAKSQDEKFFRLIYGYLKFAIKEKNIIKALSLKMPNEDLEIRNFIIRLRKKVDYQFQIFLKEAISKREFSKKNNLKLITSLLLGAMDRLILEATLFGKKLNIKRKTFQVLQIITPILKVDSK